MSSYRARTFPTVRIAVCTFLPLLGVVLLVSGLLGVVSFGVLPILDMLRTRAWVPVPAAVEEVSLRVPNWPVKPPLEALDIRYRYEHAGTAHQGVRYDPHGGLLSAQAGRATIAGLQATPAITVWMNPVAPAQAIVHRDVRWQVLALALPSLALALGGGVMIYWGMVAWTREEPEPAVGSGQT